MQAGGKMAEQIPIAVMGASGRMGRMLVQAVDANPSCRLIGVTERPGSEWIGQDLGECLGGPSRGLIVHDDPIDAIVHARAVLDFTSRRYGQSCHPRRPSSRRTRDRHNRTFRG